MALVEMVMPKMGESIMEGTILTWLKKVGDKIEQDESVLEVATDKVDTEVPATHAGILKEILANEGEVVEVGKPIAIISTGGGDDEPVTTRTQQRTSANTNEEVDTRRYAATIEEEVNGFSSQDNGYTKLSQPAVGRFYSPLVLTIAREEGISMQELEYIPGSGADNRVTKKDILNYVNHRKNEQATKQQPKQEHSVSPSVEEKRDYSFRSSYQQPVQESVQERNSPANTSQEEYIREEEPEYKQEEERRERPVTPQPVQASVNSSVNQPSVQRSNTPTSSYSGRADIIEMDRMRKMIAQRMVDSKRISPHVTSFVEADVTNIVYWRNRVKHEFKNREGDTITYTPIFIEAIAKAIRDYPMINASVEEDRIIVKKDINIGMAVALPSGNLIVPVIKNADQLNIVGLTKRVNDLARRARDGKITPDDLSDGTYTMSNVGSFGNVMGTPIIVQPQIAIMAFGAIQKKPAVIESPFGDTIGVRHFMFLSHSYDHRVVDGSLGGMFVRRVADYLEGFDMNRKVF